MSGSPSGPGATWTRIEKMEPPLDVCGVPSLRTLCRAVWPLEACGPALAMLTAGVVLVALLVLCGGLRRHVADNRVRKRLVELDAAPPAR
jgi:hypothetical protein